MLELIGQNEIDSFITMVNTFVDCMIYEPCNVTTSNDVVSTVLFDGNQYINREIVPTSLHPYLESFAHNDNNIIINGTFKDNVDLAECIGPGNGPHYYMKKEGANHCYDCNVVVCKTCTFPNGTELFCVNCFAASNFVSVGDLDLSISTNEMVTILNDHGCNISTSDPVEDIMDIYDTVVNKSNGIYSEEILQNVTVPQETPLYLRYLHPIITFDLNKGASFMDDEKLDLQDVIEVLEIIQQLVHIKKPEPVYQRLDDISCTYSVIPTVLIEIANKSRHEACGYKLLKRCIRHALDSGAVDIRKATVSVVKVDEQVGLLVVHKVKASMKQDIYDVKVCFNKTTIISCSCTCKCGGQGQQKIICIHILPVLYQISLLVFEGLAENILVELAAYVSKKNESTFTESNVFDLLNITSSFIFCATKTQPYIPECSGLSALKQVLHVYSVGTNKQRKPPQEPTDRNQLKSLRELDRRSCITKAAQRVSALNTDANIGVCDLLGMNNDTAFDDISLDDNLLDDVNSNVLTGNDVQADTIDDNGSMNHVLNEGAEEVGEVQVIDETLSPEEYSNIANACWDVCRLLKHKSCDKFMVALRSVTGTQYGSITRNMIPASLTKHLLELFSSANGELHRVKKHYVSETSEKAVVECLQEEESDTNVPYKKRQTCCCCKLTNRYDKSLRFTKVPKTKIVLTEKSNNNTRLSFYSETFRRKIFLQHFGLSKHTKNSKYLLYCSNHLMQSELFQ
jgi:hypothetical protein